MDFEKALVFNSKTLNLAGIVLCFWPFGRKIDAFEVKIRRLSCQ